MAEVIGVRFKEVGKVYYFDPDGHTLKKGDRVIITGASAVSLHVRFILDWNYATKKTT